MLQLTLDVDYISITFYKFFSLTLLVLDLKLPYISGFRINWNEYDKLTEVECGPFVFVFAGIHMSDQ